MLIRDPSIGDVLNLHSHLDDGALGPTMLDQPVILVTALAEVSSARAYRAKQEHDERMRKPSSKGR